jgi:hypothetical protein
VASASDQGTTGSLCSTLRDEYGRVRLKLDESMNRPGVIEVDGDLDKDGPIVILRFEFASEPAEYLETLNNEIDFGSFRVAMQGPATVSGSCDLTKAQVEVLIEQLQWLIRPEGE